MKKIVFIAIAFVALVSCKKDFTCECTSTITYDGETSISTSTVEIKNITKRNVRDHIECVSIESVETQDGETYTEKIDCEIK